MTDARSEDNLASLKTLPNVRLITEPRRPYIVVNRDNAEILAGAENQSGEKIDATAIVSEESAYVGLVRELIGPSLLSDT